MGGKELAGGDHPACLPACQVDTKVPSHTARLLLEDSTRVSPLLLPIQGSQLWLPHHPAIHCSIGLTAWQLLRWRALPSVRPES